MFTSLHSTERRLITLFVGGAFLFLLIFEGMFILGRIVTEKQFSRGEFTSDIAQIEDRRWGRAGIIWERIRPPIGLARLTIERDGTISSAVLGPEAEIWDIRVASGFLTTLPADTIIEAGDYWFYRKPIPTDPSRAHIFIRIAEYPLRDIIRDILRFLALDLFILMPFYFMGRYFVRETLRPVEENMDAMSHFVHDAGHELRTPLAIVSGNLQVLRDMKGKDVELIDTSISTIDSMADSLGGLVELSNLTLPKKREHIDLLTHINDIVRLYEKDIEEKNITLTTHIPQGAKLKMESKHFSILWGNLMKNAIAYNTVWWNIGIRYEGRNLSIVDTGIGMTEENTRKIFDRFYRVDRSGAIAGSGIGLALVDRIVKLYGWEISVKSILWEGTTFSLRTK
jgi:signal transduction histidine kinase